METRYKRGARYEQKIAKALRESGWIAVRSAGSHSPIDVIAINPKTKEIRLIQCKYSQEYKGCPPTLKEKLEREWSYLNGDYSVEFFAL